MPLRKSCLVNRCKRYAEPRSSRCPDHRRRKTASVEAEKRREQRRTADGRNRTGYRRERYGGQWAAISKQRRAEQPQCQSCGADTSLTVDHETLWVLCRRCHGRLEAKRRADKKRAATITDAST